MQTISETSYLLQKILEFSKIANCSKILVPKLIHKKDIMDFYLKDINCQVAFEIS